MKTIPILIAMLVVFSAKTYANAELDAKFETIKASVSYDAKKDLQNYIDSSRGKAPEMVNRASSSESPTHAVTTVMEINPGVWKGSDGSTIRDMGPLGYTISKP
jgi:hypothetical protein